MYACMVCTYVYEIFIENQTASTFPTVHIPTNHRNEFSTWGFITSRELIYTVVIANTVYKHFNLPE